MSERKHGTLYCYQRGCRRPECREVSRVHCRRLVDSRKDLRVLIDGRLTAPLPPDSHGKQSTYTNHWCRCVPCTEANSAAVRAWKERQARQAP